MAQVSKFLVSVLILTFIACILLFASFVLPWWGLTRENQDEYDGNTVMSYGGYSLDLRCGTLGERSGISIYTADGATPLLFKIVGVMVIGAMITTSLFLLSALLLASGRLSGIKLPVILVSISLGLCLAAPIVFMIGLPNAMESDIETEYEREGMDYEPPQQDDPTKSFFGDHREDYGDDEYTETSWGGDIGWYLMLVVFALLILSLVFTIVGGVRMRRGTMEGPPFYEPQYEPPPRRMDHRRPRGPRDTYEGRRERYPEPEREDRYEYDDRSEHWRMY